MLPILRIIPVGGVLLAIVILVLALNPPAGPHLHSVSAMTPSRGALIAREEHPEWRQFLILAALRRADELSKLRDLPGPPVRAAPVARGDIVQPTTTAPNTAKAPEGTEIAAVQQPHLTDRDDISGSVQSPAAAIPVEIGEASSTELPVIPHKERPPVIMMPKRATLPDQSSSAPEPARPNPESGAPDESKSKHANREIAPEPVKPKPEDHASDEPKTRQASREITPEPVKPQPENRPRDEPKARHANLETRPERVTPRREIRHIVRERAIPRREVHVARRVRHSKTAQLGQQFDLLQALFGTRRNMLPRVDPASVH